MTHRPAVGNDAAKIWRGTLARRIPVVAALVLCACGSGTGQISSPTIAGPSGTAGSPSVPESTESVVVDPAEWTPVAGGPLSARTGALAVAVGQEVFVFGGRDFLCPPTADCAAPTEPPFADGAAYDVDRDTWRLLAPAPVGLAEGPIVASGSDIYVIERCVTNPDRSCPEGSQLLLRYRTLDDEWDELAPVAGVAELVAVADTVVAYGDTDEQGEASDHIYDAGTDSWAPLPDDPIAASFDRRMVAHDGGLLLFATPIEQRPRTRAVAHYDATNNTWTARADSGTGGFAVWEVDGRIVLEPHFADAAGGIYDPRDDRWSPLPEPPSDPSWRGAMAGARAGGDTHIEADSGWLLDLDEERWIRITDRELGAETSGEAVAAIDDGLFVFGGDLVRGDEAELSIAVWLWRP